MEILLWPITFAVKSIIKLLILPVLLVLGTLRILAGMILGVGSALIYIMMFIILIFLASDIYAHNMNNTIVEIIMEVLGFSLIAGASVLVVILEGITEKLTDVLFW